MGGAIKHKEGGKGGEDAGRWAVCVCVSCVGWGGGATTKLGVFKFSKNKGNHSVHCIRSDYGILEKWLLLPKTLKVS